jgi:hypothetical protein
MIAQRASVPNAAQQRPSQQPSSPTTPTCVRVRSPTRSSTDYDWGQGRNDRQEPGGLWECRRRVGSLRCFTRQDPGGLKVARSIKAVLVIPRDYNEGNKCTRKADSL